MDDKTANYFVVEYSVEQNAFHVCAVADMLKANLRKFALLVSTDYVPLAVMPTYEAASSLAGRLRREVDQLIASEREKRLVKILEDEGIPLSFKDLLSKSL